jgi:uncharacterized membrane protein
MALLILGLVLFLGIHSVAIFSPARCKPDQVLFLDDNLLNVEAAQRLGMHAIRVRGATEVQRVLISLGIIG